MIRTLQEFAWKRDVDGVLVATVRADAFCHSMVRALVGACVAAGDGRLAIDRPAELRDAATRTSEFVVAPAKGLTLAEVGYPPDEELAARAEQTRARRDAATAFDPDGSTD
jgi:tRNA pseudouridine38-40 synthase